MTHPSFNLIDAPWLPVERTDGSSAELSLFDVLVHADRVRNLEAASPLCTVALHRLLLAIVYRSIDGPTDSASWRELWRDGLPAAQIQGYLQRWHHRFDLFDVEHPFFQVAGFATVDKKGQETAPSPAAVLRHDATSGNNKVLFDHSVDARAETFTPAQAARMLVGAQAWALGGGKGPASNRFGVHPYASHAPLVGGIVALVQGKTLAQTLLLNLLEYNDDVPMARVGEDWPAWEADGFRKPGAVVPLGYLDYLTLPARAVRLLPEERSPGEWVVRRAFTAQGCSVDSAAGAVSPMWVTRLDDKRGIVPLALRADRAVWRDASALFGLHEPGKRFDPRPAALRQARMPRVARAIGDDARLRVRCFGLVNDKAKPVAWRVEELPATVRLLQDLNLIGAVRTANGFAEDAGSALRWSFRLCVQAVLETNDKKPDKKDVDRISLRMMRHAGLWDQLERHFRLFILDLTPATRHTALAGWLRQVESAVMAAYHRGARFTQGDLARRLHGSVVGENALRARLRKLHAQLEALDATPADLQQTQGEAHV